MNAIDSKMSKSSSLNSIVGEKHNMKQFILAAQDYSKNKSEDTASLLSRYLQLLGVTLDLNTFDPHSSIVAEFFISLHELMMGLESRSNLVWCCVGVLQQACKNPAAHKALIHTYQFLPILSRLLGDHLSREKKKKLLTLMQELTYGINISWQVSHLPQLITILTRWVEVGEEPIVALSLGVLLNLCYRNLPVIYTLMRTVNTKNFLRTIMAMKNPATEVQVCKLLIILEHINGEVPKDDVLNFIHITFKTIVEAFKSKDLIRLRHIVEFFLDVRCQENRMEAVSLYPSYATDVTRVLDAVENSMLVSESGDTRDSTDLECMALLFEFLQSLVDLNICELGPVHSRIVGIALGWVQTEMVCSKALSLLKTVAFSPSEHKSAVLVPLASGLSIFLHILHNEEAQTMTYMEHCRKMGALMQLLRALVRCDAVRAKVLAALKQEPIVKVLAAVLGNDHVPKTKDTFSSDGIELCIHTLALLCELSPHDESWRSLCIRYLNQRQVHMILAQAFFMDCHEMKMLVFEVAKMDEFPKNLVARAMCDLQPLVVDASPATSCFSGNGTASGAGSSKHAHRTCSQSSLLADALCCPVMSVTQALHLDQAIDKFKDAMANNQVSSIATSEVMELYEYKMSSMVHAERVAQASMEAASQLSTHLQHRVAQMSTEVARLHQLLFHTQQCHEEAQKQLGKAEDSVHKLTAKLTKEEIKGRETSRLLADRDRELERLESKHEEMMHINRTLTKKLETHMEKNKSLMMGAEKLEDQMNTLRTNLEAKTEALTRCNCQIEQMGTEIKELEELRRQHEQVISVKERELAETLLDLSERKKILDTITRLTTTTNN